MRPILVSFLAAAALALQAPAAFGAADPIEGTWSMSGGSVRVTATGSSSFTGVVVAPTTLAVCVHPAGQVMWDIHGGSGSYAGTHVGFWSNCTPDPDQSATWTVTEQGGVFTMRFCVTTDVTNCYTLSRLEPPAPTVEEDAGGAGYGFSVTMRAEASKGANRLFPSYIQSRSTARGSVEIASSDATRITAASGSVRVSHEYLLFTDELYTLEIVGGSFHARSGNARSLTLQVRVTSTNLENCLGSTGTVVVKDGGTSAPDRVGVSVCGTALSYVNSPRNHDLVKVRIWKLAAPSSGSSSGGPF